MSLTDRLADVLADLVTTLDAQRAQTAALVVATQNATRLRGDRPIPVGVGGVTLAWAGAGRITGWTLRNLDDAPAVVTLRDSRNPDGEPVALVVIPTGESRELAGTSVSFGEGLFFDAAGARVTGVVWIGAET
ncbi:MAG: hypothetical protein FWF90_17385 [Promicromonosporaceae bacterium]|nr:hypothetical protein [Promicromonosporaceae bacterium]